MAGDAARLMDAIYRRQRHFYDATRKFFLLGRDGLIADLDVPAGGTVLELGCGTGRNLIKIARRYPTARCYGIDVSAAMLQTARASIARAGLSDRIRLAEGDAATFDSRALFGLHVFDRVAISYALSMIPRWRDVLRRGAGAIAAGGALHIVDFGDQRGLPLLFKKALEGWLARFHVVPRTELVATAGTVARDIGLSVAVRPQFRGYATSLVLRAA